MHLIENIDIILGRNEYRAYFNTLLINHSYFRAEFRSGMQRTNSNECSGYINSFTCRGRGVHEILS